MNYEYKARSYGDAGTSSNGRRAKKTTTASRRARFNGVVALTATELRGLKNANDFRSEKEREASTGRPAPSRAWERWEDQGGSSVTLPRLEPRPVRRFG